MAIKIASAISFVIILSELMGYSKGMFQWTIILIASAITYAISNYFKILPKFNYFNYRSILYILWLLKEIYSSALYVVRLAWRKNIQITPQIIEIDAIKDCEVGTVIYANSITLTPGTITLNTTDDMITVHALDSTLAVDLLKGDMKQRINKIINTVPTIPN
ncbi:Na+/H+ antiporter subunit E [Rickettsia endosymbiont of Cardiosporidium cionae]|uniref:Na+/H+ antiporter subunit E n=1 Tax=Rickettsia endosymbiont of Cardiosporidium cionae TaxID=2777155 RepID=UPI00189534F5|nr:Na+/H+ antiporter subunit E [Rickettsia endosymbiont of Cardiosporidium cionae]KAF8818453.1 hypothetical protein IHI24_000544 [Rickettsia endosymbiont of Cardiosporidium cionae]